MSEDIHALFGVAEGNTAKLNTLVSKCTALYSEHPTVFEANVGLMLDKMDFM